MDSKIEAPARWRQYEDFEPKTEVISEDDKETLVIYLPGFEAPWLKLTPNRLFKVSGVRQVANNKWSRVAKEYPASANGDLSRVTAKFENDALSIVQPKLIAKVADKEKPAEAESKSPAPPKSAEKPANVEAQAQPKQEEEGSNNNWRVIPVADIRPMNVMQNLGIVLPERHPKNLDAKLIAKVADKAKPAGAESTSPATPKSAEKPAHVEAQAQAKQKEEGSNNNGRAKPLEDRPLKQKEESKMAPAQKKSSKEYSSSSVAAGQPAANAKTSVLAKKETDEKMKGTVAEDDGAVVGKARKTSDDQKHRNGNGNGNGNSLARIGGWTKTLMTTMIGSKPRMVVNIVLVVVVALLLGLYITSSPMPAKCQQ